MIRIEPAQEGQTISAPVGEVLETALGEKPTTGHRWEVTSPGTPVCSLQDSSSVPSSRLVGAGGIRRFTFRVEQPGEVEIRLVYRRAWETDKPPLREFRFRVRGLPELGPGASRPR